MEFQNKTILVTGGSRGIGKAISFAFAEQGARVAISFKSNREAAKKTISELPGEGHLALKANMAEDSALQKMVDKVLEEFEHLDVLVNNAGVFLPHPIAEVPFEDWKSSWSDTLRVNLTGPANLCYLVGRHMMSRQAGQIVNISSRGAFRGEPDHPAYAASKAGLNALSQSLAKALGQYGIGVSAIAPGFVATEMTEEILNGPEGDRIRSQSPFERVAQPEEVAEAVLFLASGKAPFTSGAILDLNGASYLRT